MAQVELKNGQSVAIDDQEVQRILYALTTLQRTPIGKELNVARVCSKDGIQLWPGDTQ